MDNALYAEIDRLKAENAVLTGDVDEWRRQWKLMSAAEIKAEEEVAKLKAENKKLKSNIRMLIEFVPEGYAMPMGWCSLVQQVRGDVEHD
jgi:uncharacterized small protein (DUF1192 family)